jgi:hypothetical protein
MVRYANIKSERSLVSELAMDVSSNRDLIDSKVFYSHSSRFCSNLRAAFLFNNMLPARRRNDLNILNLRILITSTTQTAMRPQLPKCLVWMV